MEEWQDLALNNRRIPHGYLGKRGKAGRGADFEPKNAIGEYTIQPTKRRGHDGEEGVLIVHDFDETKQGLVCSFRLGRIVDGVMLLAGSRKTLKAVMANVEQASNLEDETNVDDGQASKDAGGGSLGEHEGSLSKRRDDDKDHDSDNTAEVNVNDNGEDSAPNEDDLDEQENVRVATFQKNSFRNPKFWIRWRGQVRSEESQPTNEENSGYLVFTKNDCRSFSGTISCQKQGWNNLAIAGTKVKSKVRGSILSWSDFQP